ncbi:unnamed protein product [Ectocarpus sp. 12 AP-2014]
MQKRAGQRADLSRPHGAVTWTWPLRWSQRRLRGRWRKRRREIEIGVTTRRGHSQKTGRPPKERRAPVRCGFSRTVFMLFSAASATTVLRDAADGHAEDEW